MDKIVIEKNNTNIFKGLIALFDVSCLKTSLIGDKEKEIRIIELTKVIIQYVSNLIFPILIFGKKIIDIVTNIKVIMEIINVATINK